MEQLPQLATLAAVNPGNSNDGIRVLFVHSRQLKQRPDRTDPCCNIRVSLSTSAPSASTFAHWPLLKTVNSLHPTQDRPGKG